MSTYEYVWNTCAACEVYAGWLAGWPHNVDTRLKMKVREVNQKYQNKTNRINWHDILLLFHWIYLYIISMQNRTNEQQQRKSTRKTSIELCNFFLLIYISSVNHFWPGSCAILDLSSVFFITRSISRRRKLRRNSNRCCPTCKTASRMRVICIFLNLFRSPRKKRLQATNSRRIGTG